MIRQIELLAPAKNYDIGIEAIKHGADAVYIGAESHGARQNASNSVYDIQRLVEFAHKYYTKVYVTLNTLVYDNELKVVEKLIKRLYDSQVDALIIQDLGILRLDIPPIALHASTQCDIRNISTARLFQSLGFNQIVLARELSIADINEIHKAVDIPIEVFIHGALCVCYSGCCSAGFRSHKRSGNRGECPQICRLPFTLTDSRNQNIIENKHLLSLNDMNRIHRLKDLIDAGAGSFKIEGRLKDSLYIKNVVAAYRNEIDSIISAYPDLYSRSSQGYSSINFVPDLSKSFNRGYTEYFLTSNKLKIGSFDSPKMTGNKIGVIKNIKGNKITFELDKNITLNNGDGLGFFNPKGNFIGFRLNNIVEGQIITNKSLPSVTPTGTPLYRNLDYQWQQKLENDTASRWLYVSFNLRYNLKSGDLIIDAADEFGHYITKSYHVGELQSANKPQREQRIKVFSKLGETIWKLKEYKDEIPNLFIAASILTTLRRDSLTKLESCRRICRKIDYKHPVDLKNVIKDVAEIGNFKNIANKKAYHLLRSYNAPSITEAIEIRKAHDNSEPVMECKYCIRRETDTCLLTENGKKLHGPLYLKGNNNLRYKLDFDCKQCRMLVYEA